MPDVITSNLDIWSSAILTKSTAGRGNNGKQQAYGIKKLRELILELAVRGKLVPQDPNDEPASVLLEKTMVLKKRLMKEKAIRKTKSPTLPPDPPTYELPNTWVWTNLYEIGEIGPRNDSEDDIEASFIPMQLISEYYGVPVEHEIKQWGEIRNGFTHFKEEDVVLAKITPCFQNGKSAVMRGLTNSFGAGTTELHVFRPINSCVVPEYVLIYLKSPRFISEGIPKMTGTAGQKRITRDYFAGNHFPLPPLAEQHRIVKKVDELMALCDQLEQQQNHSFEAHQTLVETLLGTLTNVGTAEELAKAWTRIANHFDTLFTTEHSIDQLKQTILQLAVMGKLVPQDPNDEPASVLLRRLFAERDLRLKECEGENPECTTMLRKLKKISPPKAPFPLPKTWACANLIQVSLFLVDCHNKTAPYSKEGIPIIRTSNIRERCFNMDDIKFVSEDTYNYWSRRCPPAPGDIIFTREAPMGEAAIIPQGALYCLGQRTMLIRPVHDYISSEYLLLALTEPHLLERASEHAIGSTVKHLRVGDVESLSIPIPPLSEQHRIVIKVDELMALCDALKASLADAQSAQIDLADSIVKQAVA